MSPSVPLREVSGAVAAALEAFGAEPTDLYRALCNHQAVAELWIRFAWGMRKEATTTRALRELMILRSAQVQGATYQWRDHTVMARNAGVSPDQVEALDSWDTSDQFDEPARAALALTDEMIGGGVSDETLERLTDHFTAGERVELIVTAGYYCMVPRVLNALRLGWDDVDDARDI